MTSRWNFMWLPLKSRTPLFFTSGLSAVTQRGTVTFQMSDEMQEQSINVFCEAGAAYGFRWTAGDCLMVLSVIHLPLAAV